MFARYTIIKYYEKKKATDNSLTHFSDIERIFKEIHKTNSGFIFETDQQDNFFFMSTKILIRNAENSRFFHMDGTRALMDPDLTLLLVSFSDNSRRFHPVAIPFAQLKRLQLRYSLEMFLLDNFTF